MRILHEPAARGVKANFAAVTSHPAAAWSFSFLARAVIIIHAVVILAQHGQIRWLRVSTILVRINVVDLAPISGHVAVWPRAHEILGHG